MRQTKRDFEILLDQKCREALDSACAIKREGIPRNGAGEPCCDVCHTPSMCVYATENEKDEERGKI